MGLFDIGAGDDRAVLQHILKVDQVAVVHVLGKVIGIVEDVYKRQPPLQRGVV